MLTDIAEIVYEDFLADKLATLQLQGNYRYFLPLNKSADLLFTTINYPIVPKGREGLRIVVTARHSLAQITDLVNALKTVFP